jgi:hypothetical protein
MCNRVLDYKQSHKYLKRLNECHFERSREIFERCNSQDFSTSLEMTQPIYETACSDLIWQIAHRSACNF